MRPSFFLWAATDPDIFDVFDDIDEAAAPARAFMYGSNDAERLANRVYVKPVVYGDDESELRFAGLVRLFPSVVYVTSEPGQRAFLAARARGASVSAALSKVLSLGLPDTHTGQLHELIAIHQENEATAQSLASLFQDPAGVLRQAGSATNMNNIDLSNIRPTPLLGALAQQPQRKPSLNISALAALPKLRLPTALPTKKSASVGGGFFQPAQDNTSPAPAPLPGGHLGPVWVPAIALTGVGAAGGALVASKHRVLGALGGAAAGVAASIVAAIVTRKVVDAQATDTPDDAPNPPNGA